MAISKITLNGVTQMDVTQKTVTAGAMLNGVTSLKNDGTDITGNIPSKTSSDLTVNGATVTAPAGHYQNAASKSVASGTAGTPTATVEYDLDENEAYVTPKVVNTTGYITGGTKTGTEITISASDLVSGTININAAGKWNVTNKEYAQVPIGSATTPATTVTANPSISVSSGGLITATASATKSVTPTVGAGYVSSGTAGTITVSGSNTSQLSTQAAQTIHPSSTDQTIESGKYLTGTQTIKAVTTTNLSAENIVSGVTIKIGDSTDDDCVASVTGTATIGSVVDGRIYQDNEGYLVLDENGNGNRDLKDPIRFFDYDGRLVASYISVPDSLPIVPVHEGLKNGVWNYNLQQIQTQFNATGSCDIGANYMTVSEKTEIDVEFVDAARLSPYLRFGVNGTVTVDWGDGSNTEDVTGTSLTSRQDIQHAYSSVGRYTITLSATSGSYSMYGNNNYTTLLHVNTTVTNANKVYSNCVKAVRIGASCSIATNAFNLCSSLSSITIPSGVTSIGVNAFYGCFALSSVTIPSGVMSIGNASFSNCYSLSSITIPSGVTSIGANVFAGCYALSSITIPSGVTSIGTSVLYNCHALSSITIPSSVTSIGNGAFQYCYALSSVTIPSGVTSIGNDTFYGCNALSSITIPSSVMSIGTNTFNSCYALSSVTIPSGVTSIGDSAFYNCYGIAEYHFERTTPPTLGTTVFNNIQSDCVIYVPRSSGQTVLNAYKTATNWSDYASYMQEEPA